MKHWFFLIGGFIAGVAVGALATKKHYDDAYDSVVEDIYNECYREAKEDLDKTLERERESLSKLGRNDSSLNNQHTAKIAEKGVQQEYKRITELYSKPSLEEILVTKSFEEELGEKESIDAEYDPMNSDVEDEMEEAEKTDDPDIAVISERDFYEERGEYGKSDIFFYSIDEVFTDEQDQILNIQDLDEIFADKNVEILSALKSQPDIDASGTKKVYVRNDFLGTDFEVYLFKQAYNEIAFETDKERQRRISKRKIKQKEM